MPSTPSLKINITNYSPVELEKWFSDSALTFNETLNNAPSDTVAANDGSTTMAASQNALDAVGTDVYSIQCGYQGGGLAFGVRCMQNAQVFGIGASPVFSALDARGDWKEVGPGGEHTWTGADLTATARSTVDHASIVVDVIVKKA